MRNYSVLILTDHSHHTANNSLYELARALARHNACRSVDVASRGAIQNKAFFEGVDSNAFWVRPVQKNFAYDLSAPVLESGLVQSSLSQYDWILLRLPPPLPLSFFHFLVENFPENRIVNRPSAIMNVGSKAFLLEVADLCPPIRLCQSLEEIRAFSQLFPIVLKPLYGYGGGGIYKTDGQHVWSGDKEFSFDAFWTQEFKGKMDFLAMKFLKNVYQGDKRVLVVNGNILGASLRLPKAGSWMCNVALGGHSVFASPAPEERFIASRLSDLLLPMGIAMFGFDTLVGDEGKRVLSEINVLSIGGIVPMEQESGMPVVQQAADGLWNFALKQIG